MIEHNGSLDQFISDKEYRLLDCVYTSVRQDNTFYTLSRYKPNNRRGAPEKTDQIQGSVWGDIRITEYSMLLCGVLYKAERSHNWRKPKCVRIYQPCAIRMTQQIQNMCRQVRNSVYILGIILPKLFCLNQILVCFSMQICIYIYQQRPSCKIIGKHYYCYTSFLNNQLNLVLACCTKDIW